MALPGEALSQVTLRLTTQLPKNLCVPDQPLAVPARLTRYGLSEVVNSLLRLETPIPFDFLLNDELLQTSLHTHLVTRGISAESVLSVEYIPAVGPFTPQAEAAQPDWLSSVSGAWAHALVTGCYDGVARLWGSNGQSLGELRGHAAAVTCVSARASAAGLSALVVTGSADGTGRAWTVTSGGGGMRCAATAVLEGAAADGVASVCCAPDGKRCATGGVGGELSLWRLDAEALAAAGGGGGKRRKGAGGREADGPEAASLASSAQFAGHSGSVAALCWPDAGTLYSGGWDHTLRCWDVEKGSAWAVLNDGASKSVFSLDVRPGATQLIAFAGAEKAVRVWDARGKDTVAQTQLSAHSGWVACVRWCPWHDQQLLSAGQDGTLKLWDLRGAAPVHSVEAAPAGDEGEETKLCGADWWLAGGSERFVGAGGSEGKLRLMRASAFKLA